MVHSHTVQGIKANFVTRQTFVLKMMQFPRIVSFFMRNTKKITDETRQEKFPEKYVLSKCSTIFDTMMS